jgi:hypothetical protein
MGRHLTTDTDTHTDPDKDTDKDTNVNTDKDKDEDVDINKHRCKLALVCRSHRYEPDVKLCLLVINKQLRTSYSNEITWLSPGL